MMVRDSSEIVIDVCPGRDAMKSSIVKCRIVSMRSSSSSSSSSSRLAYSFISLLSCLNCLKYLAIVRSDMFHVNPLSSAKTEQACLVCL